MIAFEVPGTPVAKGRARISTRGGSVRSFTPEKTVNFEARVAMAAAKAMGGQDPLVGPVKLEIFIQLAIPASWSQKKQRAALAGDVMPCGRPDWDNFGKAISDGGNGIVWKDDSQIVDARVVKRYADVPGVFVEATAVNPGAIR